jgi:hypothetical protein
VQAAYTDLDHRHIAMLGVWTLSGPDAITPAADPGAALKAPTRTPRWPRLSAARSTLRGWRTVHPRTAKPGPASVAELRGIRRELKDAKDSLTDLPFRLASALYIGKPSGARQVVDPDAGEPMADQQQRHPR